jgi:hypothetical protein
MVILSLAFLTPWPHHISQEMVRTAHMSRRKRLKVSAHRNLPELMTELLTPFIIARLNK